MANFDSMVMCAWELAGATVALDSVLTEIPCMLDEVKRMDPKTFSGELDKAIDGIRDAEKLLSEVRSHLIATKKEWINYIKED